MNKTIFAVWIIVLILAFSLLALLSSDPRYLLRIEESQPDAAYGKGLKMVEAGRLQEAVKTFRQGERFYRELFEETGMPRHKAQVVLHQLAIANAYARLGATNELDIAIDHYHKVIEQSPEFSQGQPHVSLGDVLQRLERYEEAIRAYAGVFNYGDGRILLEALYGRGRCYWLTNHPDDAADDWYLFLRYWERGLNKDQWKEFRQLPVRENPRCHLILALACQESGEHELANTHLSTYIQTVSNDRYANYLHAVWNHLPIPSDSGPIALADAFYPDERQPRPVRQTLFNLYQAKGGLCQLTLEMAGKAEGIAIPEAEIVLNGLSVKTIRITSTKPREYAIPLELRTGKNYLRITALHTGIGESGIELFSISLFKG